MSAAARELAAALGVDDAARAHLPALRAALAVDLPALIASIAARLGADAAVASRGPAAEVAAWLAASLADPLGDASDVARGALGRWCGARAVPPHAVVLAVGGLRDACAARIEAAAALAVAGKLVDLELALVLRHVHARAGEQRRADQLASLQTLTAGLAHEVRNPLNAAQLQLELAARRAHRDSRGELAERVKLAQHEIDRLAKLLAELLAFARPSAPVIGEHDAAAIARGVIASEQPAAEDKRAELRLIAAPTVVAPVDAAKLEQIVASLVRNAIEAVPVGGHVAVRLEADARGLRLEVRDDGPGIPDAVRARMFEPFFSTKPLGTGLGMSIAHGMVAQQGGAIDVDTGPNGTTCRISIPRARASAVR